MRIATVPAAGRRRGRRPLLEQLEGRELLATLYVATSGSDANQPGNPGAPLRSIQHAVTVAASGDLIKVAAGTYGYDAAADNEGGYTRSLGGTTSVVNVVNKAVHLYGGYTTSDWNTYNPGANLTVIDGGSQVRGVMVVAVPGTTAALDIRGFTIQHGLARSIPNSQVAEDRIAAYGGGMFVNLAPVNVQDVRFLQNRAVGESQGLDIGGNGGGGALAMRSLPTSNTITGTLSNVVFDGNIVQGGSGATRGGFGVGGGLFTVQYTLLGTGLTFTNNQALGGLSNGSGYAAYGPYIKELADGAGGGLAIDVGATANLSNVTVSDNRAIGGNAPNGDAGAAFGGGVYGEEANFTMTNFNVYNNFASGGVGVNNGASGAGAAAGFGNGGGLMTINTNTVIERSRFVNNTVKGGDGTGFKGVSGGGGLSIAYQVGKNGYNTGSINNTLIAGNIEAFGAGPSLPPGGGGGGGGLWIDGSTMSITQSTIADNQMVGGGATQAGQGIIVFPKGPSTTVTLAYNIIANHQNSFASALDVRPGATVNLNRNLFANNSSDTSGGGILNGTGSSLYAASAGFVSPGAPNFDYRLTAGSPAIDAAAGSSATVDYTNQPRQGTPDLGAFEYRRPPVAGDYDGDGRADLAVYRQANGYWLVRNSSSGRLTITSFGDVSHRDIPVPGDYYGTGTTGLAVYRPTNGYWFLRGSDGRFQAIQFGDTSQRDIPVPADYDGVGRTELAFYRPSNGYWIIRNPLTNAVRFARFGTPSAGDVPAPADYLGLGTAQLAVYRPSTGDWFISRPDGSLMTAHFGDPSAGDVPAPGNYDGVGRAELAVYRPSNGYWIIRRPDNSLRLEHYGDPSARDIAAMSPAARAGLGSGVGGVVGGLAAAGLAAAGLAAPASAPASPAGNVPSRRPARPALVAQAVPGVGGSRTAWVRGLASGKGPGRV